jgi:hypothetical protein
VNARSRRPVLALAWLLFVIAWCFSAFIGLGLTTLVPCGGDGGQPYAAPASPAGRYCTSVERYLESGEPGEVTTALVYLSPVALLVTLGAIGVWRRSGRMLLALAALAISAIVLHMALAFSLDNRCSPDSPSISGCEHY